MAGHLQGDRVRVKDAAEASRLFSKGGFGTPLGGGGSTLDLLEALYLLENRRFDVESKRGRLTPGELLEHAARVEPDFALRYVVYRDLRNRAHVVKRADDGGLLVLPRGGLLGKTPAKYVMRVVSERGELDPAEVAADVDAVRGEDRNLVLALVDEEGDLTCYEASEGDPCGDVHGRVEDLSQAEEGVLLADRVMVFRPETIEAVHATMFYGRHVGPGLQLSLAEALHLAEESGFRVRDAATDEPLDAKALRERAGAVQRDFDHLYRLFRTLKERGLVIRTGFKFGTHFRAYKGSPDASHAPYLIHAIPDGARVPWPEVSGFVRLGHAVRKRLLFATGGRFLQLERMRPS